MLSLVFSEDPMFKYLFPPAKKQLDQLDVAMRFLLRLAEEKGTVERMGDASDAILAYYPPGNFPPSLPHILWEIVRSVPYAIPRWIPLKKIAANLKIMGQLEKKHPLEPHWYISIIAVNPAAQGKGLGAQLIQKVLLKADAARQAVYLETTNPKNHGFYQRHGFRCIEELQPLESSPKVWLMLRPAQ